MVVSHDRYFLNQVADRLIVVADGRAKVIEGDYETYQRLAKQEAEAAQKKAAAAQARAVTSAGDGSSSAKGSTTTPERRRRKFPYRKPDDIEREIARTESEVAELEQALGDPDTYRDADTARITQERYDTLKQGLSQLYEHWEEALELNT